MSGPLATRERGRRVGALRGARPQRPHVVAVTPARRRDTWIVGGAVARHRLPRLGRRPPREQRSQASRVPSSAGRRARRRTRRRAGRSYAERAVVRDRVDAELQRDGHVAVGDDLVTAVQVAQRAGDPPHSVEPAPREPTGFELAPKQRRGPATERRELVEPRPVDVGVRLDAASTGDLARGGDPTTRPSPRPRPTAGPMSSSTLGRMTGTRRSNRSTSGPDTRLMYRCRIASLHGHAPGFPPSPHGHGFIAATSRTLAGNATVALARLTRTTPSSSGWRRPSSTGAMNSASSSRKSTPLFARLSSPGRIDAPPPPTSETIDELWWGARNGGWRDQPAPRQAHARSGVHDRDVERLRRGERRQQPREARREHRLARARRAHHQEVMATRGRDLDGEPAELVPPDVREIRAGQGGLGVGSRHDRPRRLAAQHVHELGEGRCDPDRCRGGRARPRPRSRAAPRCAPAA